MSEPIKGYKVFNPDWTCRDFQYEVGKTFGKDVPQEEIDKSVRIILDFELHRNPELSDAFAEYALDLAMDSVVKELGIKYNPEAAKNLSDFDKAICSAVDRLAKIICPF